MVNDIFDSEKNKKSGVNYHEVYENENTEHGIDDLSESEVVIVDNVMDVPESNNVGDDGSDDDSIDESVVSLSRINHDDDDVMEEIDDYFLSDDDASIDMNNVGEMDIAPVPLDDDGNEVYRVNETTDLEIEETENEKNEEESCDIEKDELTVEVCIGKKGKKKNIRLAKVNKLATKNLIHLAREKLIKLNLGETRFNANERRERERLLREEVYEEIVEDDKLAEEGFARFNF